MLSNQHCNSHIHQRFTKAHDVSSLDRMDTSHYYLLRTTFVRLCLPPTTWGVLLSGLTNLRMGSFSVKILGGMKNGRSLKQKSSPLMMNHRNYHLLGPLPFRHLGGEPTWLDGFEDRSQRYAKALSEQGPNFIDAHTDRFSGPWVKPHLETFLLIPQKRNKKKDLFRWTMDYYHSAVVTRRRGFMDGVVGP